MCCKGKEAISRDGQVVAWLTSSTFRVLTPQGSVIAVDRTGRAQPGRPVTLLRVGDAWRIA